MALGSSRLRLTGMFSTVSRLLGTRSCVHETRRPFRQVYGAKPQATVADLADVARESRQDHGIGRLLHGANHSHSGAVRIPGPGARPPPDSPFRRDGSSDAEWTAQPLREAFRGTARRVSCCETVIASSVRVSRSRWRNLGWRKCWERQGCRCSVRTSSGSLARFAASVWTMLCQEDANSVMLCER